MGVSDAKEAAGKGLCIPQRDFCQRCVCAHRGGADRVLYGLSVDVTKLRDMLLLNEARHFHGNTALCSQPDAKPLNYIFSG